VTERDLQPLFAPRTVALVGASEDRAKWGGWMAIGLLTEERRPDIYLINRRGGELHGQTAYTSLEELPVAPELVLVAVPAAAAAQSVSDALAVGARAIVVIAAGFGEGGEEGLAIERRMAAQVREAGAVLLGPNCLGLIDTGSGLNASGGARAPRGPFSLASQSGNLALEIGMQLEHVGLGFARLVSVGNQADIGVADVLASFADHEATRVAAAYVEDPGDGDAFVAALRRLSDAGKPALVLKAGRSEIGARAALSHTGSLAGSSRVFAAAVRDGGGILVRSPGEIVDRACALLGGGRIARRSVAVVADGGGHGVVAADLLVDAGFEVVPLAAETAERIRPELRNSQPVNPIDLAGMAEEDVEVFERIGAALIDDPGIDAVLYTGYFGGYAGYTEEMGRIELDVAGRIAALRDASAKPVIVQSMQVIAGMPAIAELRRLRVPAFEHVERAVDAMLALVPHPPAPARAAGIAPATPLERATYPEARALLREMGVEFPEGGLAADEDDVAAIASRIGGPVALKAVSPELVHKTDAGGVVLGLATPLQAVAAAEEMRERLARSLDGIWVEAMSGPGVDLVVGARRDPCFGPVVLVGAGGIFVEVLDDVAIALAPVHPSHVAGLLRKLRCWPLLAGVRGAAAVDVDGIARVAVAVGDLLCGRPDIAEVEVNPLRASAEGVTALDARVIRATMQV
jgi:acyl-CoA synthetase (NDP forming)